MSDTYIDAIVLIGELKRERDDLLQALRGMVEKHVALVMSGECGSWNPEEEGCVRAARAAIARAEGRR